MPAQKFSLFRVEGHYDSVQVIHFSLALVHDSHPHAILAWIARCGSWLTLFVCDTALKTGALKSLFTPFEVLFSLFAGFVIDDSHQSTAKGSNDNLTEGQVRVTKKPLGSSHYKPQCLNSVCKH